MVCKKCGASLSEGSLFCSNCGTKAECAPAAPSTSNSWFTPAGGLDDQLSGTPVRKVETPVEPPKPPVAPHAAASAGATFIKPVKGLKDTPATLVHREPEPVKPVAVESVSTDPAPVMPVAPVKEEPKCKKCGAVVPKGTTLCWKCSTSASTADKTVSKIEAHDVDASIASFFAKNRKAVMIVAASVTLVVVIMMLSMGGTLNEREMIEFLPEDITSIYVDDKLVPLRVDSLKVDRRQTKEDVDIVYCVIELSTDSFAVTKYQQLTFEKYNDNKWILNWYTSYATEKICVLKVTDELYERAIERIESRDDTYAKISQYIAKWDATVNDRAVTYVFDVNKSVGLMSVTGQMTVEGSLVGDEDEGYFWSMRLDDSEAQINWAVDGTWNGGMSNWGMGWYEFTMNISSLNTDAITCTWSYDQDGKDYSGDGSDCWIIDGNDEMIEFGVSYGSALASYIKVTFYIDGTCVASVPFLGDFYMELR